MPHLPHLFSRDPIYCPSCHAPATEIGRHCGFCGYSAEEAVKKFNFKPPALERFVDAEGRLKASEKRRLSHRIDQLERKYPQITFYFVLMRLSVKTDSREFGYWLFNASYPQNEEDVRKRPYGILFLIDLENRLASVTVGYGLDPFLTDSNLQQIMHSLKAFLQKKRFFKAIDAFGRQLEEQLHAAYKNAQVQVKKAGR